MRVKTYPFKKVCLLLLSVQHLRLQLQPKETLKNKRTCLFTDVKQKIILLFGEIVDSSLRCRFTSSGKWVVYRILAVGPQKVLRSLGEDGTTVS